MSAIRSRLMMSALLAGGIALIPATACDRLPGRPKAAQSAQEGSPEWTVEVFNTSCRGCHAQGAVGAAVPLMDSAYWRAASDEQVTRGVLEGQGMLMPAFGLSGGGPFTPAQASALTRGMRALWGGGAQKSPEISGTLVAGNASNGKSVFDVACAGCHGVGGSAGSVTDPMYLRLISDQGLWTAVVAGRKALGSPAWNEPMPGRPNGLTTVEVADVVAYLSSQRPRSMSELKP
ncbi:MAG: c-type cytochrome [Planctomycetes bacterium]|nr:c-type cytochrome [Planctomycetota bacterium]